MNFNQALQPYTPYLQNSYLLQFFFKNHEILQVETRHLGKSNAIRITLIRYLQPPSYGRFKVGEQPENVNICLIRFSLIYLISNPIFIK